MTRVFKWIAISVYIFSMWLFLEYLMILNNFFKLRCFQLNELGFIWNERHQITSNLFIKIWCLMVVFFFIIYKSVEKSFVSSILHLKKAESKVLKWWVYFAFERLTYSPMTSTSSEIPAFSQKNVLDVKIQFVLYWGLKLIHWIRWCAIWKKLILETE